MVNKFLLFWFNNYETTNVHTTKSKVSSNTKSKMGGTLIWEGYDMVMSKKTPILMYRDTVPKKNGKCVYAFLGKNDAFWLARCKHNITNYKCKSKSTTFLTLTCYLDENI